MNIYVCTIDGHAQPDAYATITAVCRVYTTLTRFKLTRAMGTSGLYVTTLPDNRVIVVSSHNLIRISRPTLKKGFRTKQVVV